MRIFACSLDRPGAVASVDHQLGRSWLLRRRRGGVPALGAELRRVLVSPNVITLLVRWYLRYALSNRDVEELLIDVASRWIMSWSIGGPAVHCAADQCGQAVSACRRRS